MSASYIYMIYEHNISHNIWMKVISTTILESATWMFTVVMDSSNQVPFSSGSRFCWCWIPVGQIITNMRLPKSEFELCWGGKFHSLTPPLPHPPDLSSPFSPVAACRLYLSHCSAFLLCQIAVVSCLTLQHFLHLGLLVLALPVLDFSSLYSSFLHDNLLCPIKSFALRLFGLLPTCGYEVRDHFCAVFRSCSIVFC